MRILALLLCINVSINVLKGANALDMQPYNDNFENKEVELLISYKLISKDNLAQGERYRVSHVMNYQHQNGYEIVGECEIDASKYAIMDDMPYFITFILKREKEQVLDCLYTYEVRVRENTTSKNNTTTSRVSLEIAPTRVKAKLVNKSILLYILSKE